MIYIFNCPALKFKKFQNWIYIFLSETAKGNYVSNMLERKCIRIDPTDQCRPGEIVRNQWTVSVCIEFPNPICDSIEVILNC